MMSSDSENDTKDGVDSENETSEDEVLPLNIETDSAREMQAELEEYSYEVLSTENIYQHMLDSIKEVNTVVEIPATTTRGLLDHFKWDKEKLLERYYDANQDQLFAAAGVINPFRKPKLLGGMSTSGTEECLICFSDLPASTMASLECGHRYCKECWCEYLTTQILDEGLGQNITCVDPSCGILVDDATVMRLVREPAVKRKYQRIIANSFVECNRLLRWCPSPPCSNVIKVANVEAAPVTCSCTHKFCFSCGENWHEPISCCLLRKWVKKSEEDTATSNWIATNAKLCPKCNYAIEKNGGCNHMTCKNCKAEFCWLCLQPWLQHRNCNSYAANANLLRGAQETSRLAFERYQFYCSRYKNHMKSLSFKSKLYASVKKTMEEMQQHITSRVEVQFLKKAVDILLQCWQTLMYSYVFAFYLRNNIHLVIFEENQVYLESATETLAEYLERDITVGNLTDMKQRVQDMYKYCETRRKILLEHVREGHEKDIWDYAE